MEQTKLKISDSLLCAAIYFIVLFGGYTAAILLAGYVLLFEENRWLKENAVRAITLMVFFAILTTTIGFASDSVGILSNLSALAHGNLSTSQITRFISLCTSSVILVRDIMFLCLGFKALHHDSISVMAVENIILTHTFMWRNEK